MKILSFGDIIWDVYPNRACIGGAMLNFSAHIAKSGADSYLASAVGDDKLGTDAIEKLKNFGVDVSYVGVDKTRPTGQCQVTLDENAVPTFRLLDNVAYDNINLPSELFDKQFDAIAFGSVPIRHEKNIETLSRLIGNGKAGKVYCDINLRAPFFNERSVLFCLENSNVLKVSEVELEYIVKNVLKADNDNYEAALCLLKDKFEKLELILLTCGEDGAYAYICESGKFFHHPAKKVEVVSTVGAGDSFGAAFLVEYLSGKAIPECMSAATERSAYVVSHMDAVPD